MNLFNFHELMLGNICENVLMFYANFLDRFLTTLVIVQWRL